MDTLPTHARAGRREWIGLAVIALPCLLYSMDLTVLNLALPRLSAELRPTSTQLLWIVDIYGFLVAGLLVTMGTLGDRIGRRKLLLAGAAAFGAASVFAAFATSPAMLIAARAVLGVAGATLAPSTLSLIRNMFLDAGQRTVAIGVWATSFSLGSAIGPLLGGVLLEHFWWGAVFLLAVPVMALLLVVGPMLLPEHRDPAAGRMDLVSAVMSLVAVLAVVYGVKHWAREGLDVVALAVIGGGLAVGGLFVRRQRRMTEPLIDLGLFRVPVFRVSLATFTVTALIVVGSYLLVAQYLQLVAKLSPFDAGLWMLPGAVCVIAGSMLAPVIARRVRPAYVLGASLTLAALGFGVQTQVADLGLIVVVVGSALVSLGLGPVFTLGTDLVVGAAPPARAGAAAAISETSAELGAALGIAVLGSVATALYRTDLAHAATDALPPGARAQAAETLGGAVAAAEHLPPEVAAELLRAARAAFTHSLAVTVALCAVTAAVAAVTVAIALRRVAAPGSQATGTPAS